MNEGMNEWMTDSPILFRPLPPGGERVPFLFTIKELAASGSTSQFGGDFSVPSYRGSSFLDPKGRGASTGYDSAQALPAAGNQEELEGENIKDAAALKGSIVFNIAKVSSRTGQMDDFELVHSVHCA